MGKGNFLPELRFKYGNRSTVIPCLEVFAIFCLEERNCGRGLMVDPK